MSSLPADYKRKRSRVACEPCRERKRKCNGDIPCSTCTSWGYDCHYKSQRRIRHATSGVDGHSASAPIVSRNPAPSHAPDFVESLEANSGAAFVRKIALKADPTNAPKLNLFGWNIGTRTLPSGLGTVSVVPIVDLVSLAEMQSLANTYFSKIDICYGFIDSATFFSRLDTRWESSSADDSYDSVLAGVAALGLLFSERNIKITEMCLIELARSIMDSYLSREPPSLDIVTAWALRVVYMRMTAPPYPAWIASSTLMHLIEAAKLQHESPHQAGGREQCDPDIRRRLVGVSRHLNLWISYDLGLSRVSLANDSLVLPSSRPGDSTVELLNLFHVSASLGPENENNDKDLEGALLRTLSGTHTQPPSILGQCNLVLCLLRRLRMTNLTASSETMMQILSLFTRALDSARAMLANCCPWHHVANVPFQMITVILEMDTSPALAILPNALQTLKLVASTYDTDTMQEAYSTARLLITLYQRRRSEDTKLLGHLLDEHPQEPVPPPPSRATLPNHDEVSWLEGLVADVPTLQGVDIYEFLQTEMLPPMSRLLSLGTKLSHSYPWVSSPFVVGAPMRIMSGPSLAVAVSRSRGLGFMGSGPKTENIIGDLEEAAALVGRIRTSSSVFGSTSASNPLLPVGVGFQLWNDEIEIAVAAIGRFRPCAAWLFAPRGGQRDIDTWSQQIRQASPETQIWVQIGSVSEAKQLISGAEAPDVVVVQGAEAGGHGRAHDGIGLITLLPEISDTLARYGIPLFAAGGISDGRGAAAALCLGASGVVMGTRFLAAKEVRIARGYQDEILRAGDGAVTTTRTTLYNQLRGTHGWPQEYSPRTIINRSFVEHQDGKPFEELKVLHDQALKCGDLGWGPQGRLATYAGASVGLVHDVKGAGNIVQDVREEVLQLLFPAEKSI
ncbi:hypothetical protein BDV59DRAFT_193085 [Aspergillus ambiguus]|uniref:uncharacterized protein n=1 Tax=Aspergillus ambiguus TaxID=176160 RepID=UPI003CCCB066